MSKQISDTMRHAMYDCATNEMFEHFFLNSFFLFSFFILTNAKCKCHMQMPWLVLPMCYATIVPWYAIDRLLTTDLTVNFLWMQTKHDANLYFLFLMQMPFIKMQMQMSHAMVQMQRLSMMVPAYIFTHDAKCLFTEMEMQNVLWCKCLLMGMSWCKCFL